MIYMNNMIGRYVATMLLALVSLTGWSADATVTIDDALTHGSITTSTSGSKVTLTAKPDVGYFLNFDDLSVKAYTDAGGADGRQRASIPMYTIDVTNNGDGTYSFTMPTEGYDVYVTAVFSQVTVTLPAGPYTYNGTAQTPTPTVKIGSTSLTASTEYIVDYSANTNVGTANVTVSGAGKYFGTATASFTIGKVALTVKANDHSIGHGDEPANNGVTYSGFVNGETSTVLGGTLAYAYNTKADGSGTPYTATSPIGTYYIIPSGLTSGNYDITFTAGTLTVSAEGAAGLNLSLDASLPAEYFIYSGTAKEPAVVVKDGETTLTKDQDYTVAYSNNINAGENTAVATVTGIGNYSGSQSLNFTINKKALTVTAKAKTITYGEAPANDGVTYSGFVAGEDENTDGIFGTSALTYDYDYTQYGDVGNNYTITPKGLTATNYAITFTAGTLTVQQKEVGLTWMPNPATFVFDSSAQEPTATVTGTVNSDAIGVTVAVSAKDGAALTDGKAVSIGSYTATATGLTGDKAANYKLPEANTCDFTITAASFGTITATGFEGEYDGGGHGITVTAPAGTTVKYRTDASGDYGLTANPTFTDACETPYTVYYQVTKEGYDPVTGSATVTINKKALTATVTAQNKIYDGNTTVEVSATVETGVTGETLTISGLKGAFSDVNAGTDNTVTINTSAATVTAGENTKVSNYTVNYPATTTANITPATLTIKANDVEIEIGSSDPTLTYTVSGLQGTDTEESVMSGALARDKGETLGSYVISLGTLSAGNNYTISFTGATLTIYRMLNGLFSGDNEWATFTWSEDLALPAGITAYIIKAVSEGTAEATALTYIPQKIPVMLRRSDTTVNSYKAYAGTGTDDVSDNLLAGSDADDTTIVPYQDYVLYNDLFVLAGVNTVGATHAYLPASAIGSQAAARLTINAIGDLVGIDEVRIQELQDGTGWYTLNGRKLDTVPTKKGLYIKDGRKVVIK